MHNYNMNNKTIHTYVHCMYTQYSDECIVRVFVNRPVDAGAQGRR